MILSDEREINYMKRVLVIVCVSIVLFLLLVSVIHDGLADDFDRELCGDHGIIYFDPYPLISVSTLFPDDNLSGERDKGGMLVDKNLQDSRLSNPGTSGGCKDGDIGAGGFGGHRHNAINKVSEPGTVWLLLAGLFVFVVFRGK